MAMYKGEPVFFCVMCNKTPVSGENTICKECQGISLGRLHKEADDTNGQCEHKETKDVFEDKKDALTDILKEVQDATLMHEANTGCRIDHATVFLVNDGKGHKLILGMWVCDSEHLLEMIHALTEAWQERKK